MTIHGNYLSNNKTATDRRQQNNNSFKIKKKYYSFNKTIILIRRAVLVLSSVRRDLYAVCKCINSRIDSMPAFCDNLLIAELPIGRII